MWRSGDMVSGISAPRLRWVGATALSGVVLAGCGGRVAMPAPLQTPLDAQLSCAHLAGERGNNDKRLAELSAERAEAVRDNLGYLVASPLFLDLSDTRRAEADALRARNEHLASLMTTKGCPGVEADGSPSGAESGPDVVKVGMTSDE